jgi:hypothetical protein
MAYGTYACKHNWPEFWSCDGLFKIGALCGSRCGCRTTKGALSLPSLGKVKYMISGSDCVARFPHLETLHVQFFFHCKEAFRLFVSDTNF